MASCHVGVNVTPPYEGGAAKGVNRAARPASNRWFVNEELLRFDAAAEKSERPRDHMTVGYFIDTSGL
jgi:hypothetical protein